MTEDDKFNLEQLMSAQWQGLGSGGFNQVFVSKKPFTLRINDESFHQHWVRKKPLEKKPQNNSPRSVRVWNELHPSRPAITSIVNRHEWIAPYFGSFKATDKQTAQAVLDVYKRTGRIVIDACGIGNAMYYADEAHIIDVDVALIPGSPASDDFDIREVRYNPVRCGYDDFWNAHVDSMPQTVDTIKTLCYIQKYLCLTTSCRASLTEKIIEQLHHYRLELKPIDEKTVYALKAHTEKDAKSTEKVSLPYESDRFFAKITQRDDKVVSTTLKLAKN